ncbi:MAG: ribose-phosphate pyrophosphokinase [Myxococcota bacterium]
MSVHLNHIGPLTLLTCAAAAPLVEAIARNLNQRVSAGEESWFSCGEGKYIIGENIRGADAYIFQSPIAPGAPRSVYDRFVMLLHAVEAAALSDADHVTAVVPYYPGARQDKRKGRVREGISAGLFARMLQEAGATRVVTIDIHNEAIAGMFDPTRCRLENIHLTHRLAMWCHRKGLCGDTIASPDVGGMERARSYAAELGHRLVGLSKERDYSTVNRVLRSTLIGDVAERDVMLVDDIIDTGGSVCAAVDELKRHGARHITVSCTHPVMSGPAWKRLSAIAERARSEGWRFSVVGSTSVYHPKTPDWFHSYPISRLLTDVIVQLNQRGSVTGVLADDEAEQPCVV